MPDDSAEHPVTTVFDGAQSIPVLDMCAPSADDAVPRSRVVRQSDLVPEEVTTPPVVIAGDHQDVETGFPKVSERAQRSKVSAGNDGLPLEPEIEQIAVNQEGLRPTRQRTQKCHQLALDVRRAGAEMYVRDHVARGSEHSLILVCPLRLYKLAGSRHPPGVSARTSSIEFRVRYSETDQMGIVYHAHYLIWCEIGRTEHIRTLGPSYRDIERAGNGLAVVEAHLRYHAPARYDDQIRVETTVADVGSRTVTFDYLIANIDSGQRLATARTTLISLDRSGRVTAMPGELRRSLAGDAGLDA